MSLQSRAENLNRGLVDPAHVVLDVHPAVGPCCGPPLLPRRAAAGHEHRPDAEGVCCHPAARPPAGAANIARVLRAPSEEAAADGLGGV